MSMITSNAHEAQARLRYWQVVALLQATILGFVVLFLARPDIDIAVAAWAAGAQNAFPVETHPPSVAIRDAFRALFWSVAAIVVLFLVLGALRRGAAHIPLRIWWFLALSMALGPGLLVNVILKNAVGRPRPFQIEAFGGPHAFALPFEVTDACQRNCSFVSGEAAAMGTLCLALGALLWRSGGGLRQQAAVFCLVPPMLLAGGLRVAMGRHFLSDVIFAWLLCALVVAVLYGLLRVGPVRHRFTATNLARDLLSPLVPRRRRQAPSEAGR